METKKEVKSVKERLYENGFELADMNPLDRQDVEGLAFMNGWEATEHVVNYNQNLYLVVQKHEPYRKYNNGLYGIRRAEGAASEIIVLVPTTVSNTLEVAQLKEHVIEAVKNHPFSVDMQPYDYLEIISGLIDALIIKPLSKPFDGSKIERQFFENQICTLFLSYLTFYNMTPEDGKTITEEDVNAAIHALGSVGRDQNMRQLVQKLKEV